VQHRPDSNLHFLDQNSMALNALPYFGLSHFGASANFIHQSDQQ
jgi:hypothetical protein